MNSLFGQTFISISSSLLNIVVIALIAGLLTHKKIITQDVINGLSRLVVIIFLPFLIFYTILTEFNPAEQSYWWTLPIAAIFMSSAGLLLSWLLFIKKSPEKKFLFPLSSMQNAAYLILPIGQFVYPDQFEEFSLICFLVVLGLSPFMWTVGKLLLTNYRGKGSSFRKIITPPFVANILSITVVLTGMGQYVPGFVIDATGFLGKATVPVATFILGATLVISVRSVPPFLDSVRILGVKFILLPLITLALLLFFNTAEKFPLLADVLVIQSASAPATAHILQLRTYGGNLKEAGGIIFVGYLVCIVAIPFWLTVWKFI